MITKKNKSITVNKREVLNLKFFKIVFWPFQKIIEFCIIWPLGLFIQYAYGIQYLEYKFNKPVMKILKTHERINKFKFFEHETTYNVIISYCIFHIVIFFTCYLITIKMIQIPNDSLIVCTIKSLKTLFKYDTLAVMFCIITLLIYDKIIYHTVRLIHNFFVSLVQL